MRRIRTLIVDDSAVVRRMLTDILGADPEIEVVGVAGNGAVALQKIDQLRPDAITLDVEMPDMSGLEVLRRVRGTHPRLPVIMFSALTEKAAATTVEALARGATDYVTKPSGATSREEAVAHIRQQLLSKLKGVVLPVVAQTLAPTSTFASPAIAPTLTAPRPTPTRPAATASTGTASSTASISSTGIGVLSQPLRREGPPARTLRTTVLAIGSSTGGPNALTVLLSSLTQPVRVPIVITQHMPPMFTRLLADRLGQTTGIRVREATDGEVVAPGEAVVAPGDMHMKVVFDSGVTRVHLDRGPPENSCRPAVDVMFRSLAASHKSGVLGVILTGMGQDGLVGSRLVVEAGGHVLAQDEATSVVWGMPGFVARAGLAAAVLPLQGLGAEISRRLGGAEVTSHVA